MTSAEIGKISERETHHTLLVTEVGRGAVFEADIPNYVLRNLKLVENQRVRAALRRESLWVIPGRDNSPAWDVSNGLLQSGPECSASC